MAQLNKNQTGGNLNYGNKAVTATAQQVVGSRSQRVSLLLRNYGLTPIFLGDDPNVTTSTGFPLDSDEEMEMDDYVGAVYAISATTGDLRYFEIH
jgi:hypothetical protein